MVSDNQNALKRKNVGVAPDKQKKSKYQWTASEEESQQQRCVSIIVKVWHDPSATDKICSTYELNDEQGKAVLELAKTLGPDDPAIFVTFRPGDRIRTELQRPNNATGSTEGRPCDPGNNDAEALQNLRAWVIEQVPQAKQNFVKHVGENAMAIGNLTQDEYNTLANSLSFSAAPFPDWVVTMVGGGGESLGGLLSVFGTGFGVATLGNMPSIVFRD